MIATLRTWWLAWRWAVWLAVLAASAAGGWWVRDRSADAQIARMQADQAWRDGRAAQDALTDSREAQTQHEATSKRLAADLAASRAARDAALRGLRTLPASDICPAGAAQPRPDPAGAGADGPDRADAGDPAQDAIREAGIARDRAVMYNALLDELATTRRACGSR